VPQNERFPQATPDERFLFSASHPVITSLAVTSCDGSYQTEWIGIESALKSGELKISFHSIFAAETPSFMAGSAEIARCGRLLRPRLQTFLDI